MSARRFVAYFFAIAAGSTFAFASTLRGQPAPQGEGTQEVAMQEAAMQKSLREQGMPPTPTDAGQDALPPVTARLFRQNWNRRYHARAVAARVTVAR